MLSLAGSASAERWLLERILIAMGQPPFRLVLGNVEAISRSASSPIGSIIFHDRQSLFRMLVDPQLGFGDGYSEGTIRVEGDLQAMLEAVYRAWPATSAGNWFTKVMSHCRERLEANTPQRSRQNVHHHYDLKTDFYQYWLDSQLVYTCGYFPAPTATLEEAQIAKMDYICRKLQLQPGESVVEAGCGWGAMALHMARRYGVRVKAFNLSHEQVIVARQRARLEGLTASVEFVEDDYRNISGHFDVFVSVGMLEHVGTSNYPELGRVIHRSIGSTGRGFLHFIGRNRPAPLSPWISKRIFPGAYSPTLGEVREVLEPWNYSICDVENLRLHYAKTLEHWLDRFERSAQQISDAYDPKFVRAWRLYLAGSLVAFKAGTLQLFQITFAGADCRCIPWTRAYLYENGQAHQEHPKWTHSMS
jgi:cyclopropane-fatty-acyl-phospholipid synthase